MKKSKKPLSPSDESGAPAGLRPGDTAPAFTLPDGTGSEVSLDDFRGKSVVLYFYPRDSTPGCTIEACDFRDNLSRVRRLGAVVLGVSADSVKSHAKFSAAHDLTFPLLSDENREVCGAYGAWQQKSFMGRKFMGIVRSTFIIDGRGKIVKIFSPVKVAGHVDAVIDVLKGAKSS